MPTGYEILIEGHLDPSWFERFDEMIITLLENGETRLCGSVVDQAALHGLLNRIRDLNLKLVKVERQAGWEPDDRFRAGPTGGLLPPPRCGS